MERPDKKEFKPELETPFQSPRYLDDTHASAGQYNIDEYSKAQDKYIDFVIESYNPHILLTILAIASGKVDSGYYGKGENPVWFYSKDMDRELKAEELMYDGIVRERNALAETNQHQGEALKIQDMEIERLNSLTKYCEYSDCKGIKR